MKNNERGQSILEATFLIVILFCILSFCLWLLDLYFSRSYLDNIQYQLNFTDAIFEKEERIDAKWDSSVLASNEIIENTINKSSKDMDNFYNKNIDKNKKVRLPSELCLDKKIEVKPGVSSFNSCIKISQYFSDFNKLPAEIAVEEKIDLSYQPSANISFLHRDKITLNALKKFVFSPQYFVFSKKVASLLESDKAIFNSFCLMNVDSNLCLLNERIFPVFKIVMEDSVKSQVVLCLAEASLKCAGTGPVVLACEGAVLGEILSSVLLSSKSRHCPVLNSVLENYLMSLETAIKYINLKKMHLESSKNLEILTLNKANKKN